MLTTIVDSVVQAHPAPDTLGMNRPAVAGVADDAAKVNIVPSDFKEHPATITSVKEPLVVEDEFEDDGTSNEKRKRRAKRRVHELEDEAEGVWEYVKDLVLRPGVAGGIFGVGAYLYDYSVRGPRF